jgi:multidrug transporter EmrE-like cation transporter
MRFAIPALSGNVVLATGSLIFANLCFNVLANASFKFAALSDRWRVFLAWQIIGNLAGLVTVVTLTLLLRYLPLHVAFPLTTGLAVIGVQVFAALLLFRESIGPRDWVGTALVIAGVALLSGHG